MVWGWVERLGGGRGRVRGRGGRNRVGLEELGKVAEKTLFLEETRRVADADQRAQQLGCTRENSA